MRVFLESIGCRLNQSEIEKIGYQFRQAGWDLTANAEEADLVVINTCTVTAKAAADSRQMIRKAHREGIGGIIVTGCWSTIQPSDAALLPGVVRVVSNSDKEEMVQSWLGLPESLERDFEYRREPLPGHRKRTRAFIKAQDGCDQYCTYCITRLARGKSRSRSIQKILQDVHSATMGRTQEVVLSGVQLGSWGRDFSTPLVLKDLISAILNDSDIARIRLSSIEPWDIDEDLVRLWENPRLCQYLHIPLQSGSESVLKRMARRFSPQNYAETINMIRGYFPEIALSTDVIAGFPGETDEEYKETRNYIESISFSGGHAFTFSPRPGTPAAFMNNQIPENIKRQRNSVFRAMFKESSEVYREKFIGKNRMVLWENAEENAGNEFTLGGLTDNYIRVTVDSDQSNTNTISNVRLTGILRDGMTGELEKSI